MTGEELLKDAVNDVFTEEFSAFYNVPEQVFPKSFDRKMEKLFGGKKTSVHGSAGKMAVLMIAAVTAAAVMICGGFGVFDVIFFTDSTSDPYFVNFSALTGSGAPEKIEHYYSISFPEGFYPDSTQRIYCTDTLYSVSYTDGENGYISFEQHTISSFGIGYEKGSFEIVNNFEDKTIDLYILGGQLMSRLWTDGDYIYEVRAPRGLFELIELKKLHEVYPEVHDIMYYWG